MWSDKYCILIKFMLGMSFYNSLYLKLCKIKWSILVWFSFFI